MKEIVATMRSKPRIVLPEKSSTAAKWEWCKRNFNPYPSMFDKFLSVFVPLKEMVHPVDYRIFMCKIVRGKVIQIGKIVNDNFESVSSFEELEKLDACRYIGQGEYNRNFGIDN